jgi:hypothetical protein
MTFFRVPLVLLWATYVAVSLALITTSFVTGRRASAIAGEPQYLFTATRIPVQRTVPAKNPTDAAFDALFEEAGEPVKMTVFEPVFVLGFLDVTGPVVLGGLLAMLIAARIARRSRKTARAVHNSAAGRVS